MTIRGRTIPLDSVNSGVQRSLVAASLGSGKWRLGECAIHASGRAKRSFSGYHFDIALSPRGIEVKSAVVCIFICRPGKHRIDDWLGDPALANRDDLIKNVEP
jgi:hypothetical protein